MPVDGIIQAIARRVGGKKAKEVERFIKFGFIGTLGAVIDLGVLNLLQASVLPPGTIENPTGFTLLGALFIPSVAIAVSISFTCAVLSNFTWNRYWTYPDSRSRSIRRQLSQFAIVSIIGWISRTLWISISYAALGTLVSQILTSVVGMPFTDEGVAKLGSNIATFVGIFVVMIWNFFANRYWTYNDVD